MALRNALLTVLATAALTTAQVLTSGNRQLPACAQSCPLLQQAAAACGGTTSSSQTIWSCFCQSGYLTSLKSSPTGICDSICTNAADNQQVMTWYNGECGSDYGVSEHANAAAGGGGATTVIITSTSTSAPAAGQTANTANAAAAATGSSVVAGNASTPRGGSWWSTHYKWVIMLIVLFIALLGLSMLAVWFKRRHDRKQDKLNTSFNEGITTRSAGPPMQQQGQPPYSNAAGAAGSVGVLEPVTASGRDSPARTRDAFMPYGYGYTRSESRLASNPDAIEKVSGRASPPARNDARGGTPMGDLEKSEEVAAPAGVKRKKVLVRERNAEDEHPPG